MPEPFRDAHQNQILEPYLTSSSSSSTMTSSSGKTYIACRVCESVFLSTRALINHLDSHLVNKGDAARVRKQLQISHLLSSHQKEGLIQPGPATTALPFHPAPQIQAYLHHSKRFCSPVQVPPLPPVPYSQRNPFNLQPIPNPYSNPNPNLFPNPQTTPARNLNAGLGSGSKKRRSNSVSFSRQIAQRIAATEDFPGERPFLSLLDYPIPQMMNSNCNGNSDHEQLDLTLKL